MRQQASLCDYFGGTSPKNLQEGCCHHEQNLGTPFIPAWPFAVQRMLLTHLCSAGHRAAGSASTHLLVQVRLSGCSGTVWGNACGGGIKPAARDPAVLAQEPPHAGGACGRQMPAAANHPPGPGGGADAPIEQSRMEDHTRPLFKVRRAAAAGPTARRPLLRGAKDPQTVLGVGSIDAHTFLCP